MLPRKQKSGCQKRKRKIQLEIDNESQKGALDKYFFKEPTISVENNENEDNMDHETENLVNEHLNQVEENISVEDNINFDANDVGHNENDRDEVVPIIVETNLANNQQRGNDFDTNKNVRDEATPLDIYDPRTWDNLSQNLKAELLRNGPKRDMSIKKGPYNLFNRRFSSKFYIRHCHNGEKHDRSWLVYSKELDKVFCFCCKLFNKSHRINQLANEGLNDWRHLSNRLKEHESSAQPALESAEESFRIHYFLYIVDQAIGSLTRRFEQYKIYEDIFGFLFSVQKLQSLNEDDLKSSCYHLEISLKHGNISDIDGESLFQELKIIREVLTIEAKSAFMILSSLKAFNCFPNAFVAYRILLTIPVTVASAERSFSKLKILKSYLRSTMSQDRLNDLALISIENGFLENLDYARLINDFAVKNARRTIFR